jgi:hypothetical protein
LITIPETDGTPMSNQYKDLQSLKYSATPFRLDNLIAKVNAKPAFDKGTSIVITDAVGLETNQELKSFRKETMSISYAKRNKNNVPLIVFIINKL